MSKIESVIRELAKVQELYNVLAGSIVMIEVAENSPFDVGLASLKLLVEKEYLAIVLLTDKTYSEMMLLCKKAGINPKEMIIIDCVSKSEKSSNEPKNVILLGTTTALSHIAFSLMELVDMEYEDKFVVITNLTTLVNNNNPELSARFLHTVFTKLRNKETGCVIISVENTINKELRAEIAQLCDRVVHFSYKGDENT